MRWITRESIRVNRTATCWLIRRFLDPEAEFLFVPAADVASVQATEGATSFDAPGATYPHKDAKGLCSFAALVDERLADDPVLVEMARIVQAADFKDQLFVSYEQWEDEFKRTANALGGGSGWVIFAHNAHTGELHNYWGWDHMLNVPMGRPLLVLDMYEHAYHMDYGAAAAKYVDAFLLNVNWEEVNRRAEALSKA